MVIFGCAYTTQKFNVGISAFLYVRDKFDGKCMCKQTTFQVLRAHHFSKGLASSWRAPLKVNNGEQSCSIGIQARKASRITVLNIRKLYLSFSFYFNLYVYFEWSHWNPPVSLKNDVRNCLIFKKNAMVVFSIKSAALFR